MKNKLLDFNVDFELENDCCKLIPLKEAHLDNLLVFAESEPELWKYALQQAAGKEGMNRYIQDALQARKDKKGYPFIVFDKRSGTYAGCTRLYQIDFLSDNISIGYTWYGKNFQGTGLNKSCKFLLMELIFDRLDFERLEFRLDSQNGKSLNALKSIGCVEEGLLRSNAYTREGTRRSSIVMSILKEEWQQEVKERLLDKLKTKEIRNI